MTTLLLRLKDYRQLRSAIDQVPIYCVFGDTVMRSIAHERPLSLQALQGIRGLGHEKCEQYGHDILQLVRTTAPDSQSPELLTATSSSDTGSQPSSVILKHCNSDDREWSSGNTSGGTPFFWGGRRRGLRRKLLQNTFPSVATSLRAPGSPASLKLRHKPCALPSASSGDGIYVLELAQGRVYVGRTSDWRRRLTQHMTGHGSAFTQAFPPTGTLLPRLGRVTGSAEAAERDETLRYMFLRGIQLVRGWKYTRVYMPEEEQEDAEENIRELYDLCRRCGHPGHFVGQCTAHFDRLGKPCK